jgi:spermidine synthase
MPSWRLLLLFFVSGASGLVYQVVWMRALALTLSVSVYAVTTVLCAFMAGLALGAWIAGRTADRLARPLLAFGLAEVGVGLTALGSLGLLFDLGPAYAWLHRELGGAGLGFTLGRFALAASVLLVPCTLMGTTLPLLSRSVIHSRDVAGRGAGSLYAVNTLGAVAGALLAGFVLIAALGLQATTAIAAAANLSVGTLAIALGWRSRSPLHRAGAPPPAREPASRPARLATAAFGLSGLTAIGYEVLWTRALEQFTHNSTYAYTAMLATFLIGIGAGSALSARAADRARRPLAGFGWLQLGVGLSVVAALLLYLRLYRWLPRMAEAMGGLGSWGHAVALIFGVAMLTLLGTTLLFGAQFPFVARSVVDSVESAGRRIASAYALNTLGSIAGALAVGFLLLPALGLRGAFLVLIAINLAVGAALVAAASPARARAAAGALAVAGLALALLAVPPRPFEGVFRERYGKLLLYREQVTDIVMVTEDEHGERLIRYGDGRGTAGTPTVREDRSYAHIALLAHPEPRRVLNICFGVGNSLSSVAQYPVRRIDQVELSPGVVHAAPFFRRTNRDVLGDRRVHLTIQDGRNYLLASPGRWDVIRLDPPELHTAGIVNLYTREFFELARDHLAPGGIFSLWVNIAYTPEPETKMILRTLRAVFPHVTVWHGPWIYSWVMNASVDPRPPDLALLQRWFSQPRVAADLASIPFDSPFDFLSHFVMADAEVDAYAGEGALVTDDRTVLDFSVPRSEDAYFGLSNSITDYYLADLIDTDSTPVQRAAAYCRHKRPVYPHLRNVEASGLRPEEVQERLRSALGTLPHACVGAARPEAARDEPRTSLAGGT